MSGRGLWKEWAEVTVRNARTSEPKTAPEEISDAEPEDITRFKNLGLYGVVSVAASEAGFVARAFRGVSDRVSVKRS